MKAWVGVGLLVCSLVGCSSSTKTSGGVSGGSGGLDAGSDAAGAAGGGGSGACGAGCAGASSCIEGKCQVTAFVACSGQQCPPGLAQKMTGYAKACTAATCPGASDTKVCEDSNHAFGGVDLSCPPGYHEGLSVVFCGSPDSNYVVCVRD